MAAITHVNMNKISFEAYTDILANIPARKLFVRRRDKFTPLDTLLVSYPTKAALADLFCTEAGKPDWRARARDDLLACSDAWFAPIEPVDVKTAYVRASAQLHSLAKAHHMDYDPDHRFEDTDCDVCTAIVPAASCALLFGDAAEFIRVSDPYHIGILASVPADKLFLVPRNLVGTPVSVATVLNAFPTKPALCELLEHGSKRRTTKATGSSSSSKRASITGLESGGRGLMPPRRSCTPVHIWTHSGGGCSFAMCRVWKANVPHTSLPALRVPRSSRKSFSFEMYVPFGAKPTFVTRNHLLAPSGFLGLGEIRETPDV